MDRQAIVAKGKAVLISEAKSLENAAERLGDSFASAVELMAETSGKVVCTGLGKSGHIARKMAATLSSTGTPAFFLHPAEALHGDLGMVAKNDLVLAIAYGGETAEVLEVCKFANRRSIPVVAITGKKDSTLASMATEVVDGSIKTEACPHNLAPTNSSTLAIALGDALAMTLMEVRGFSEGNFAEFHPSGSLGKRLLKVEDVMRPVSELTLIEKDDDFTKILSGIMNPNFGVVPVAGDKKQLLGAITDGDLRRSLVKFNEGALKKKAGDLMTSSPKLIAPEAFALEACKIMEQNKIMSLFVTGGADRQSPLLGIIRMHDLLEQKII